MTADTHREENGQGHTTAISKRGAASVTGKESSLTMTAGKDIHLQASPYFLSGRYDHCRQKTGRTGDSRCREGQPRHMGQKQRQKRQHRHGNRKHPDSGKKPYSRKRKRNNRPGRTPRHKEKGLLSSKTTTTYDEVKRTDTTGSIVEGDTLTMTAGKDISLTGSVAASHQRNSPVSRKKYLHTCCNR